VLGSGISHKASNKLYFKGKGTIMYVSVSRFKVPSPDSVGSSRERKPTVSSGFN
jgi:hypothetical protein